MLSFSPLRPRGLSCPKIQFDHASSTLQGQFSRRSLGVRSLLFACCSRWDSHLFLDCSRWSVSRASLELQRSFPLCSLSVHFLWFVTKTRSKMTRLILAIGLYYVCTFLLFAVEKVRFYEVFWPSFGTELAQFFRCSWGCCALTLIDR